MSNAKLLKLWMLPVLVSGLFAGCASTPPPKEEIAAKDESVLLKEKENEEEKRVREWKQKAFTSLETARNRTKEAAAIGALSPETEEVITKAQQSYNAADYVDAVKQANDAKRMAETSMNNTYLERAQGILPELHDAKADMTPEMQALLAGADSAYNSKQGKKSYDMASTLMSQLKRVRDVEPKRAAPVPVAIAPPPAPAPADEPARAPAASPGMASEYTVVRGDNLWNIAGKSDIYANPFQWPLIYKANRSQIKDADLIYPKQQFRIDRSVGKSDVDSAVQHAKKRGAWTIGKAEKKDKSFLSN